MVVKLTMRGLGSFVAIAAISSSGALWDTAAYAQQKTAKQCAAEWRANKADNQAKGITEKAFVTQCRSGNAAAQPTAAPAAQPTAAPAASRVAAGQKTAKECAAEWRANKAQNQAQGITEKAYVAQCRSGTAAAQPTTAPAQQTTPAAAPATAPRPATGSRTRETTATAPAGANRYANEAQAKARCPSDTVVWVNEKSRVYHFSGHKDYGNTKEGTYMCERDAMAAGDRAAKNEKHP